MKEHKHDIGSFTSRGGGEMSWEINPFCLFCVDALEKETW